jgi:hypothetical protein
MDSNICVAILKYTNPNNTKKNINLLEMTL